MKQIYFTIILALIAVQLDAQITLTSANHTPSVGESYDHTLILSPTFSGHEDGANQTWDFSDATGDDYPLDYIALIDSEGATSFPDANIVEYDETNGVETYYYKSTSEYSHEGMLIPGVAEIIFTDAREFLQFPLSYEDEFTSTFSGTVENIIAGQTFDRSGTCEITSDGYGELILPYTTIEDVLRVRTVYVYSDEYLGMEIYNYNDTVYSWYNATNQTLLASYTTVYGNGSLLAHQAIYLNQADFVSSVSEENNDQALLSIYPNPAKNVIYINNEISVSSISIHDLSGKIVQTENISGGVQQIGINDLSAGIYYVKYQLESEFITEKLVIE